MRGAQAGATCGISMRQTGEDSPRRQCPRCPCCPCCPRCLRPPSRPHRPALLLPVGSSLHSSMTAVGLPVPGAVVVGMPPPRLLRRCGRSHQLPRPGARLLLPLPPLLARPFSPSSPGSGRARKLARRLGRPTEEMPWSRASLHKAAGGCSVRNKTHSSAHSRSRGCLAPHPPVVNIHARRPGARGGEVPCQPRQRHALVKRAHRRVCRKAWQAATGQAATGSEQPAAGGRRPPASLRGPKALGGVGSLRHRLYS